MYPITRSQFLNHIVIADRCTLVGWIRQLWREEEDLFRGHKRRLTLEGLAFHAMIESQSLASCLFPGEVLGPLKPFLAQLLMQIWVC